ncbi:hypothetical protein C8J57DRAFT_1622413 [Mycena rebaudengoi]|nr:hypothetical protein C8J57DRAFT_1622413 [Mycena rebaudengoi]
MDLVSTAPSGSQIVKFSGPLILAYLLHWGLFGSLSVQICKSPRPLQALQPELVLDLYYQAFPNDTRFKKYLVYTVYTIEFAQTILSTHDAFATFGYDFTDAAAI